MAAFAELRPQIGIAPACVALSINRAGIYRTRAERTAPRRPARRSEYGPHPGSSPAQPMQMINSQCLTT